MGIGSWVTLINATPWSWTLSENSSYQMNDWVFPNSVSAGTSVKVYVEQDDSLLIDSSQDSGTVVYQFDGNNDAQFELLYGVNAAGTYMSADFKTLATLNNDAGSMTSLYWGHNLVTPWIVGSDNDIKTTSLISSNPPDHWMAQSYDRISCLTLREVCIPGTHDSGMWEFNAHTSTVLAENTVTQLLDVYQQLQNGARFLDIRPTISSGQFVTGHYDYVSSTLGWAGANGESIADVIDDINSFINIYNELIIVQLSHPLDSDKFPDNGTYSFTQDQWDDLFTQLTQLNGRVANNDPTADLSQNTVGYYTNNKASVIIIVDDESVDLTNWNSQGFYGSSQYPLNGDYTDSTDFSTIVNDQLTKLLQERQSPTDPPFLLSWTWTTNGFTLLQSLTDNAQALNSLLWDDLWLNLGPNTYPNIISVDAFPATSRPLSALAMAINYFLAPTCP